METASFVGTCCIPRVREFYDIITHLERGMIPRKKTQATTPTPSKEAAVDHSILGKKRKDTTHAIKSQFLALPLVGLKHVYFWYCETLKLVFLCKSRGCARSTYSSSTGCFWCNPCMCCMGVPNLWLGACYHSGRPDSYLVETKVMRQMYLTVPKCGLMLGKYMR